MARNKKLRRLVGRHPRTTGAAVLIAAAIAGAVALNNGGPPAANNSGQTDAANQPKTSQPTNKTPAAPADPKQTDTETAPPESPDNTSKTVTPIITSVSRESSNIVVRGYVGGVFEDGGDCTAVFTQGRLTVTGRSEGFRNASYSTCAPIRVARHKFASDGNWSVALTYKSDTASGSSATQTVKVE